MLRVGLIGVALIIVAIGSRGYRLGRIVAYVDPDYSKIEMVDPNGWLKSYIQRSTSVRDASYQPRQSKIAVGTGGVLGVGLMQGKQKLMFLPDAHTDFIYATVGEELGLWGSTAVIAGFLVILWRGARLFLLARDDFGKYLALGVTRVDRGAGVYQYERGAGHGADQGISAAHDQLRRQLPAEHALAGNAFERQ